MQSPHPEITADDILQPTVRDITFLSDQLCGRLTGILVKPTLSILIGDLIQQRITIQTPDPFLNMKYQIATIAFFHRRVIRGLAQSTLALDPQAQIKQRPQNAPPSHDRLHLGISQFL